VSTRTPVYVLSSALIMAVCLVPTLGAQRGQGQHEYVSLVRKCDQARVEQAVAGVVEWKTSSWPVKKVPLNPKREMRFSIYLL